MIGLSFCKSIYNVLTKPVLDEQCHVCADQILDYQQASMTAITASLLFVKPEDDRLLSVTSHIALLC